MYVTDDQQMIKVLLDGTRTDVFSIKAVAVIPRTLTIDGSSMQIQQIIPHVQFSKRLLTPITPPLETQLSKIERDIYKLDH
jgi:hypothetical protein